MPPQQHPPEPIAGLAAPASSRDDGAEELREANAQLLIAGLQADEQAGDARRNLGDLNALLESLGEAVTIVDATGRLLLMNQAARALVGLPKTSESAPPEIFHRLDRLRLDGTPLPREEWPVNRALRGERFRDVELLLVRPDGARLRLIASGSAIRDDQGQLLLAIVVDRDVTALRQLEQVKEAYLALISHDLRTPLTVVQGQAQLLHRYLVRSGDGDPRLLQGLAVILAQAQRMNAMLVDLLESSRLESSAPRLHQQPTDLAHLVAEMTGRLNAAGDLARVRVVATSPPTVVSADPRQIERVLANVISNALKYSPPDSPVVVSIGPSAGEAIVAVADQGAGISPESLPLIFDRFTRVHSDSSAPVEGVGLGLYIARLIIEAHGGRFWAESEVGQGSTFHFALPLIVAEPGLATPQS